MNCIIVDDEPQARRLLHTYVSGIPGCTIVRSCANAMEAYEALHTFPVDLAFLDIKMPGLSGIEFVRSLAAPPLVILTTAFNKFALEGYEIDVVDYLLKPLSLPRLLQAVSKARERCKNNAMPAAADHTYFFVKENGSFSKIKFADIIYFEGMQNYVRLHLQNSKTMIVPGTMRSMEMAMPAKDFIRIHRSYIISLAALELVRGNTVQVGTATLPVGISYKEGLMNFIRNKQVL